MAKPNFILVPHRSSHHAIHSGSSPLMRYLPGEQILLPSRYRLPWRLRKQLASRQPSPYSSTSVEKEFAVFQRSFAHRNGIVFFLHAEHDFHFTGSFAPLFGLKSLGWFHYPPDTLRQKYKNPTRWQRLNGVFCVGENQIPYFREDVGIRRVWFLPLGIDTEFFSPCPSAEPRWRCLFVGQHLRDFELFEKVIRVLHEKYNDLLFTAVVRVDHQDRLPSVDWIEVLSGISDEELRELYQTSLFLLLPLHDVTACDAILEALACGLPVLTTDVGSVRSYVHNGAGIITPKNSVDKMVNAAEVLLDDMEFRTKMGLTARTNALQFAWPEIAKQFIAIVEREFGVNLNTPG